MPLEKIHPTSLRKPAEQYLAQLFTLKSVGYLPPALAFKMFDKQIRPILDFACEVCYAGKEDYEMEKVHLPYLKYIQHVKPSCTPAVYAECGRFPLVIKHKIQALKYWKCLLE